MDSNTVEDSLRIPDPIENESGEETTSQVNHSNTEQNATNIEEAIPKTPSPLLKKLLEEQRFRIIVHTKDKSTFKLEGCYAASLGNEYSAYHSASDLRLTNWQYNPIGVPVSFIRDAGVSPAAAFSGLFSIHRHYRELLAESIKGLKVPMRISVLVPVDNVRGGITIVCYVVEKCCEVTAEVKYGTRMFREL